MGLSVPRVAQRGSATEVLLEDATRRACKYLAEIGERAVAPTPQALEALRILNEPLPASPHDPAKTLGLLDQVISPATMATAGPRFFGFVMGSTLPAALAANWLAGAWDQNAFMYSPAPGVARLEQIVLRWLADLFDFPAGTTAGFVTGATVANFTALAAARHRVLARAGWNVEADGLFGAPPVTVVTGEEVHPTVRKSLGMLGFGRSRLSYVPVDGQGRMRADALPTMSGPTIVCLQAGNVNTGAFDPFEPIIRYAHAAGAWVHVDGAFGLWAKAAPALRHLVEGIELADSWATDAHKWFKFLMTAASPLSGILMPCRPRWRSRRSICRRKPRSEIPATYPGIIAPSAGRGNLGGASLVGPFRIGGTL